MELKQPDHSNGVNSSVNILVSFFRTKRARSESVSMTKVLASTAAICTSFSTEMYHTGKFPFF